MLASRRAASHPTIVGERMAKMLNTRKIEKRVITKNRLMGKIISYITQGKLETYENITTYIRVDQVLKQFLTYF